MSRLYVGCNGPSRELFRAASTPTKAEYGARYAAVIGPFRTKAGAMAMTMARGPLIQTVADAEAIARLRRNRRNPVA